MRTKEKIALLFAHRNAQIDKSNLLTPNDEEFLINQIWDEDHGGLLKSLRKLFFMSSTAFLDVERESVVLELFIHKVIILQLTSKVVDSINNRSLDSPERGISIDSNLQILFVQSVKIAKRLRQSFYAVEYCTQKAGISLLSEYEENRIAIARLTLKEFTELEGLLGILNLYRKLFKEGNITDVDIMEEGFKDLLTKPMKEVLVLTLEEKQEMEDLIERAPIT